MWDVLRREVSCGSGGGSDDGGYVVGGRIVSKCGLNRCRGVSEIPLLTLK